jgi:hypothetical protein
MGAQGTGGRLEAAEGMVSLIYRLPEFITFTGADCPEYADAMIELTEQFPRKVEWGILLSSSRAGSSRYPTMDEVHEICNRFDAYGETKPRGQRIDQLSAHLCGALARSANRQGTEGQKSAEMADVDKWLHSAFGRVQVNHAEPNSGAIVHFANVRHVAPIAQWRSLVKPPVTSQVTWLFDTSGGRGTAPASWPVQRPTDPLFGFAGGINPDNVMDVLEAIGSRGPFWIDMESGVRDSKDRFALGKCAKVLKAVYG